MEAALTGRLEGKNIGKVAAVLRSGGVAVLPTDTIYGFHCVGRLEESIERVRAIKGRSKSTGYIMLASSVEMADSLAAGWPRGSRDIMSALWPAPVTVILPASPDVPAALRPAGGVAVRVPDMQAMLDLIGAVGEPLVSTSVNISGNPPVNNMREIRRLFPGLEAYISRRGPGCRLPSTLVDLTGGVVSILRRGREADRVSDIFGVKR
jgi:L-threonylcarbamoyladenylate synthase